MRFAAATLSLTLLLAACGSPQDEDKLTPESIEASQSAPEKPDIALSNNPEPEPAPAPEPPSNETENGLAEGDNAMLGNELVPSGTTPIPAAFHGRWGVSVEDCIDPRRDGSEAIVVSANRLELPDASGQLLQTLGNYPERFIGMFGYNGDAGRWAQKEELSLTGSSNVLVRDADGERFRYRRCVRPKV
jgi:hypothetical protein